MASVGGLVPGSTRHRWSTSCYWRQIFNICYDVSHPTDFLCVYLTSANFETALVVFYFIIRNLLRSLRPLSHFCMDCIAGQMHLDVLRRISR